MPYLNFKDLPESVREHLPTHAQEIYRAAYNNAWTEYEDPDRRQGDESREEVSHKVAWAAVKKEYEKDDSSGEWHPKSSQKAQQTH
ncbi:MAG: ChaB family protein [Ktedonobacterales bacterium]